MAPLPKPQGRFFIFSIFSIFSGGGSERSPRGAGQEPSVCVDVCVRVCCARSALGVLRLRTQAAGVVMGSISKRVARLDRLHFRSGQAF